MLVIVLIALAALAVVLGCWLLLFPGRIAPLRWSGWRRLAPAHTGWLRRHGGVLMIAALMLLLPAGAVLLLRKNVTLEPFDSADLADSSSMIAQLLRGERLTPPPPPPPELFQTAEVRRLRPDIVTADRRWERLDADVQQRVLAIHEVMRRQYGYAMVLVEGYRSPERQAELMAAGKATRAGAWQSCHQYGLAVDSALLRDGKLQWDMADDWVQRGYRLYGELAVQAGLEWGGNWRSIQDYVHVEQADRCRVARTAKRAELAAARNEL